VTRSTPDRPHTSAAVARRTGFSWGYEFNERGEIARADTKDFLQGWMERYITWIARHSAPAAKAG
jgi:hypothetical protein